MEEKNVLTEEMILEIGIEFSGDVCYSGEYGNLINEKKDLTEGEKKIFDKYEKREAKRRSQL